MLAIWCLHQWRGASISVTLLVSYLLPHCFLLQAERSICLMRAFGRENGESVPPSCLSRVRLYTPTLHTFLFVSLFCDVTFIKTASTQKDVKVLHSLWPRGYVYPILERGIKALFHSCHIFQYQPYQWYVYFFIYICLFLHLTQNGY